MMASTLYQMGSVLSNNEYLFDDLAIVLFLGIFICWTEPARTLSKGRPTDNLFSPDVLFSIVGQVLICISFFALVVWLMTMQPWYCPATKATSAFDPDFVLIPGSTNKFPCYSFDTDRDVFNQSLAKTHENTVVWLWAHFQFIWDEILCCIWCEL